MKAYIAETIISRGDPKLEYHLATDTSRTGLVDVLFQFPGPPIGTVITKEHLDKVRYIIFISYRLIPAETRYHTTEREALAVLRSLEESRCLVLGPAFPVKRYTDHMALLNVEFQLRSLSPLDTATLIFANNTAHPHQLVTSV